MASHGNNLRSWRFHSAGVTLIELMVALAIGSFLIIGAVQIAAQSRHAFRVNESIAKVQEIAQFSIDTIEADLRMASNWGFTSRGEAIEGRALNVGTPAENADPLALLPVVAEDCGASWALDLTHPVEGSDSYTLPCDAKPIGSEQAKSDVLTIRRATLAPVATQLGRVQLQTSRIQGELFTDNNVPAGFDPATSTTRNLIVHSYYVSNDSELIPGVPTLRRKTLTVDSTAGAPTIVDLEVAPGVENLQVQFGVDTDDDGDVDRYVNPGATILDPAQADYIPAARIMTARIWLVIRSIDREIGIVDDRHYQPANEDLGIKTDDYRRLQVSKTILLRNART
ncbi:MAG TPA: PilW family protein [Woeseiaceae bacterium]|nr:PilW family protein [Woeseiaceae bacterium]